MEELLAQIDEALEAKGLSAAAASQLAVGNPSLIKNIRNGKGRVGFDGLSRLAKVLDLECYFGPPRHRGVIPDRLRAALHLEDDATELDAIERIASWPRSAHEAMRILVEDAQRRRRLAVELAELRARIDRLLADFVGEEPAGFAETDPSHLRCEPAHGFADHPAEYSHRDEKD